jgi:hypothetical protein
MAANSHAFVHGPSDPAGSSRLLAPSNGDRQHKKIRNYQKRAEMTAGPENPALQTRRPCQKNGQCPSSTSVKGKRNKYFPR